MKYYERMIRQAEEKGKRRFERQFQDALQSLEAQLNVGYSMENAIKEVQRDLQIMYDRHTLIVREFTYMVRQLNLNVTAEAAWKDFAARVQLLSEGASGGIGKNPKNAKQIHYDGPGKKCLVYYAVLEECGKMRLFIMLGD